MDCDNDNGNGENWNWQGDDYCLQKGSNSQISQRLWNEVTLNGEDLSYMLDETTPVKACGDLAYLVNHDDNMKKDSEERKETCSQLKRRRLQFDTQLEDSPFCNEEISSIFLKSNESEGSLDEVFPQPSQWEYPDVSASGYEGLHQSSEHWLAECFNDSEIHFSTSDMNFAVESDIQIDISEFCNDPPAFQANVDKKRVPRTPRNVVIKGKKSFIETPTKLPSSVAYPFAFIKPCEVHGDVTLEDINQKIRTPPSKAKQKEEDPVVYPMSAFSGKPVVGKTKIRTEGGKGSITIMRTRG